MKTVFALGLLIDSRPWFLSRTRDDRIVMRTSDPASAQTWATIAELLTWVDGLPDVARVHLAGRPLLIFPLTIAVGPAVQPVDIPVPVATPEPAKPATAAPVAAKTPTAKPTPMFA